MKQEWGVRYLNLLEIVRLNQILLYVSGMLCHRKLTVRLFLVVYAMHQQCSGICALLMFGKVFYLWIRFEMQKNVNQITKVTHCLRTGNILC